MGDEILCRGLGESEAAEQRENDEKGNDLSVHLDASWKIGLSG
jgi:hypothetical protein